MNTQFLDLLTNGIEAKRAGDYDVALKHYQSAQEMEPDDVRPYGNMARLYTALGQYQLALKYWLVKCEDLVGRTYDQRIADEDGIHSYMQRFAVTIPWGDQSLDALDLMIPLYGNSRLHFLLEEADNLTFYVGHCVVHSQLDFHRDNICPSYMKTNLENALLGSPSGSDARGSTYEQLFLNAGYLFVYANICGSFSKLSDAASFYLSDEYTVYYPCEIEPGCRGGTDYAQRKEFILEFLPAIESAQQFGEIQSLLKLHENRVYPLMWKLSALKYLQLGYLSESAKCALTGAIYAESFPARFYNEFDGDDIGTCLSYLFMEYKIKLDGPQARAAFLLAFVSLSRSIYLKQEMAFESLEQRGRLLKSDSGFARAVVPGASIPAVQILADYYYASIGYNRHVYMTDKSAELKRYAERLHAWLEDITVDGKDACDYSLEEIAKIGLARSERVFKHYDQKLRAGELQIDADWLIDTVHASLG